MQPKTPDTDHDWVDDDDAPELTDHFFKHAAIMDNGVVVREATGTLTKSWLPVPDATAETVSLRLDAVVLERLRASGPGWQSRANDILRKAVSA